MSIRHPSADRTTRSPRRTSPGQWGRTTALRLQQLEDRATPSVNLPLSSTNWTQLGPLPIAAQQPGEVTTSPGNLTSTGRIVGVATYPGDPTGNTFYIAAAGGGVWRTTDGGNHWTPLTDRIPGLTDAQRSMDMGSIAISPVKNAQGFYDIFAGEGELDFSADSYAGRGILKSSDGGATWTLIQGVTAGNTTFSDAAIPRIVVAANPTDPTKEIVYAVVDGSSITALGLGTPPAVGPGPSATYASGAPNAVYRSDDAGGTWVNISSKLNGVNAVSSAAAITDFQIDPTNPDFGYVAIGNPYYFGQVNRAYPSNGVYRTTNSTSGSPDWTAVFGGAGNAAQVPGSKLGRIEIAVAPTRPSDVYIAAVDAQSDLMYGVYRSTDVGLNFRQISNTPTFLATGQGSYDFAMAIDPVDYNKLYLAGDNAPPYGGPNNYQLAMASDAAVPQDPTGVINLTWSDLAVDKNGNAPHTDSHAIAIDAVGRVLLTNDGGVYRATLSSAGGGKYTPTWASANGVPGPNALDVAEFNGVGLQPYSAEELFGGTQDNGLLRFYDNGNTANPTEYGWAESDGGDAGQFYYDTVNPKLMYHVAPYASARVSVSTDGGKTWTPSQSGIADAGKGMFEPAFTIDASTASQGNPSRIFEGEDNVYVSTDGSKTWSQVGPNLPYVAGTPGVVTAIAVSRADPNVIYAAVERYVNINGVFIPRGPALYEYNKNLQPLSPAGYPAWVDVSPGQAPGANPTLPPITGSPASPTPGPNPNGLAGPITSIVVDPYDANVAYVTVDTGSAAQVWRTTQGVWDPEIATSTVPWTNITGNLPGHAYSIVLDPNLLTAGPANRTDDDLYVGTSNGVYRWHNPTTNTPDWVRLGGDSLPDVFAQNLQINTTTGILAVGTYGRGVWEFQIRPFVSGHVFLDTNGDGFKETGETGQAGFTVVAFNINTNTEEANTQTDANGYYQFRSLPAFDSAGNPEKYFIYVDFNDPNNPHPGFEVTYPFTTINVPGQGAELGYEDDISANPLSTILNQDFGLFQQTSISGVKFEDVNANGTRDPGEPGVQGWTIELLNAVTGQVVQTTTTGSDGSYTFANLGPLWDPAVTTAPRVVQPYAVAEVMQTNWQQIVGAAAPITLTSGTPVTGQDFGNFHYFSLTGTAYEDVNGNGSPDPGEPGLAGWTVQLLDARTGQLVQIPGVQNQLQTGADGSYAFTNLPAVDASGQAIPYEVREVGQPGWAQVSLDPAPVLGVSGATLPGGNFGNFRLVSISGAVYEDTNGDGIRQPGETTPVGGTVRLYNTQAGFSITATIQPDGTYTFTNVQPLLFNGQLVPYSIDVTPPPGYIRTTVPPAPFTLTSGHSLTGIDFGVFQRTSISGYVFLDANGNGLQDGNEPVGLGVAGATVDLIASDNGQVLSSQPVGPDGRFTITGIGPLVRSSGAAIPYQVRLDAPAGWVITSPTYGPSGLSSTYLLQSGVPVGPVTFGGFRLTSISGQVFNDLNGDGTREPNETGGAPGATVTLIDTRSGAAVATTTSGADGRYTFANLGPLVSNNVNSPYQVRVAAPAGWTTTGTTTTQATLSSGTPVGGQDFPAFKLFTISGTAFNDLNGNQVADKGEPGLAGWQVQLTDLTTGATSTAATDKNGNYSFPTLGPGVYRVREVVPAGWSQLTPNPADVTAVSGTDVPGLSFADFNLITVSGSVFEDLNRNGTQDAGESGVAGWVAQLVNGAGATVATQTTTAAGAYSFTGVGPGTYVVQLVPQTGWIQTTPAEVAVAAVSGQAVAEPALGVLRLGSISGVAFLDSNRNARQDTREAVLPNVTVTLQDAQGNTAGKTMTDAAGRYAFYDLEAGTYTISIGYGQPGEFVLTAPGHLTSIPVPVTVGSSTAANNVNTPLGIAGAPIVVAGADAGGGPVVQVYDAVSQTLKMSFYAFDPSFTGGVRVAQGDLNGDGVPDIIAVPGPGGPPEVRAFDGVTGDLLFAFDAYEVSFTGGMYVALGDLNADGVPDIITGTDVGGGPRVQVFDGKTHQTIQNYFAYESSFRGGVRVAAGDLTGSGTIDIVTTPAQGGGPRVTAFDGQTLAVVANFFAFDPTDRSGVFVATGDMFGTGSADIVVGQGASASPLVGIYDAAGNQLALNQAFPPDEFGNAFHSDVRVAVTDRLGQGQEDVVIGSGPGSITRIRFLDSTLTPNADEVRPYASNFTGGVYVG